MARLIPDFISEECKSSAERRLFERFRKELPGEITVLHSLGVARHRYKLYSEADFVLVCPSAVLVFEVKGGRIDHKEGYWFFTNRYGEISKRSESPMRQAASVCAALRNSVAAEFGNASTQARVSFGSVAFFPDIPFREKSPEWDVRRVYDLDAWNRPLGEIIADAAHYSRTESTRITGYSPAVMSPEQMADLIQFLRGNFEKIPSLGITMESHEELMICLAEKQYAILDALARNPRMVIEGSAGTGKTLIALESARRHAAQGRRVLFVCFNRLLADHLDTWSERYGLVRGVSINTLHGHCLSVLRAANITLPPEIYTQELYQEQIPNLIPAAVAALKDFQQWDVLVVDEGQDIADYPPFVTALNALFVGGFAKGRWLWFEDPRQRIHYQAGQPVFDHGVFSPSYFELKRNCRNTNEVATFTCVSTLTPLPELSGISGPKVKTILCDGHSDLLKLQLLVTEILTQGVKPEDVVLLTAGAEKEALFINAGQVGGKTLARYGSRQAVSSESIRFSSVFRFKGLESKIIVLTDVRDLGSKAGRMAAYVGMSRTRSALFLLLTKEAQQQFEQNRLQFADLTESDLMVASPPLA